MSASFSLPLTDAAIQQALQQGNAITSARSRSVEEGHFVFFAAFDGTNNVKDDPSFSGDSQSTSVGQIWQQASDQQLMNPDMRVRYYPGPGTPGTLSGSSASPHQVTAGAGHDVLEQQSVRGQPDAAACGRRLKLKALGLPHAVAAPLGLASVTPSCATGGA